MTYLLGRSHALASAALSWVKTGSARRRLPLLCAAVLMLPALTAQTAQAQPTAAHPGAPHPAAHPAAPHPAAPHPAAVHPTGTHRPAPAAAPAWTGTFDNFPATSWRTNWGVIPDTDQCKGATTTAPCNWGFSNLRAVADSTAPTSGNALKVTYPAPSGPPSCGCGLGGGQFYQNLTTAGLQNLAQSPTLDLKYWYNFPVGFDFGKKTAGKMPGLYGGVPGCESGGQHCQGGWSTRYMWRGGSSTAPNGEVYYYTAAGSGFGADLGLGDWKFAADGKWHSIEQLVNVGNGQITIWSDGTQVFQTTQTGIEGTPFSGIFFSTFHGGHDTSWSPTHTTTDEFADFSLSTTEQNGGTGGTSPPTPTSLAVSDTTSSSVGLTWTEPSGSDPAASYKVYDGSTVVATPTTTSATIGGLAANTRHTYTVTAVDSAGNESPASTSVTATTKPGGGGGGGVTVTITKTKDWGSGYTDSATLTNGSGGAVNGWNLQFDLDPTMNIESVSGATLTSSGNHQTFTNTSSDATIAPGASATIVFSGDYTSQYVAPTNVSFNGQGTGGSAPATPAGLTVAATTSSSVTLSWTEPPGSDPAVSYKVYEGGTVVGTSTTTSATINGLAANSTHTYTVTAIDSAGNESPAGASVTATTGTGGGTGGSFTQADIDSAVAAPLIAFAAPTSSVPRPGTNPVNIGAAKVLYYLALVDKENPTAKATNGTTVNTALLAQVRNLIKGGNEPDADGGLEGWSHAPVAEALLLLKNGPAWAELASAEQNRVTLLEEALGYAGNYTYNDASHFSSGICGFGNFSKTNNPNYEDGYVDVETAAIQFFGASAWDGMLAGFDDATVASQLNSAGLTNAGGCFAKVGSGANSAIRKPFVFKGHTRGDLMGIWSQLAADTFDKTVTSSDGPAHIADNTTSPEQGKLGMGHEFASTDSSGLRSSALYTFEGWMNVTGSRVAMSALGDFTCTAATSAAQYNVGSLDLIYKLHHGYVSQALNQNAILVDDHGDPATDGPNVKGYQYDHDAYTAIVTPQSC